MKRSLKYIKKRNRKLYVRYGDSLTMAKKRVAMTASEDLTIFLVQAQRCYNDLEQSLVPITETIGDLEQDWTPRLPEFWERVTTSVTSIRQTASACLALFQESSAQHASLALLISVASIEQSCYLHYLKSRVDEVGIRLTAYQHR